MRGKRRHAMLCEGLFTTDAFPTGVVPRHTNGQVLCNIAHEVSFSFLVVRPKQSQWVEARQGEAVIEFAEFFFKTCRRMLPNCFTSSGCPLSGCPSLSGSRHSSVLLQCGQTPCGATAKNLKLQKLPDRARPHLLAERGYEESSTTTATCNAILHAENGQRRG